MTSQFGKQMTAVRITSNISEEKTIRQWNWSVISVSKSSKARPSLHNSSLSFFLLNYMEASLLFVDMRMVWILSNRLFFSKAFAKILVVGRFCFFSDASSIVCIYQPCKFFVLWLNPSTASIDGGVNPIQRHNEGLNVLPSSYIGLWLLLSKLSL